MRAVLIGRLRELAMRPNDAEPAAVFLTTEDARACTSITSRASGSASSSSGSSGMMDAAKPAEVSE